ncbi:MAG: TIGR02147 family protein [Bdellovibrio sp.]
MSNKFVEQLRASIQRKQKKNPNYSIRKLAQDIDLSHSFISQVLSGKKQFPMERLDDLVKALELDEFALRRFVESIVETQMQEWKTKSKTLDKYLKQDFSKTSSSVRVYNELPLSKMTLINPWYNMAVLDLVVSEDFRVNYKWLAERLQISTAQAQSAWSFLKENKFVEEKDGRWKKSEQYLRLPVLKSSEPIRQHYLQVLDRIEDQLKNKSSESDLGRRLIVGATCTANQQKLSEVKQYLEDSLYVAAEELAEGPCTDVYYLLVSAIPLTRQTNK